MMQTIILVVLGYTAAMVTVLVFKKEPASPSETDEIIGQQARKLDTSTNQLQEAVDKNTPAT